MFVEKESNSPVRKAIATSNQEEDNTTPISQWAVSEDEDVDDDELQYALELEH